MEYYITIICICVLICITILLIKFCEKIRIKAYALFIEAEHKIKKGKKIDYVVEQIYNLLPMPFRIIPQSIYKRWIQRLFDEIKDLLDDGKVNNFKKEKKQ